MQQNGEFHKPKMGSFTNNGCQCHYVSSLWGGMHNQQLLFCVTITSSPKNGAVDSINYSIKKISSLGHLLNQRRKSLSWSYLLDFVGRLVAGAHRSQWKWSTKQWKFWLWIFVKFRNFQTMLILSCSSYTPTSFRAVCVRWNFHSLSDFPTTGIFWPS